MSTNENNIMQLDTSVLKKIIEAHFLNDYIDEYIGEKKFHLIEEIFADQFLCLKKDGISFGFEKQELTSIDFFTENYDGYSRFQKRLPFDLDFNFSRKKIREKLGKPNRVIPKELSEDIEHSDIFWFGKSYQLTVIYNDDCEGVLFMQIAAPPLICF